MYYISGSKAYFQALSTWVTLVQLAPPYHMVLDEQLHHIVGTQVEIEANLKRSL
jgi:hypothetical protein